MKEEGGVVRIIVEVIGEEVALPDGVAETLYCGTPEEGVAETVFSWAVTEGAGEKGH